MPAKETTKLLVIPRYEGGFGDWFGKALNYVSSKIGNLEDILTTSWTPQGPLWSCPGHD
ncbi:hypothetical protein HC016_09490 [Limosilactobacillus fermentum]